jgi:predicted dehydrogenase
MLKNPEIDAVAVVVKVPSHYQPTLDVIAAGRHVYTEWPLGRTTEEAVDLAKRANAKGVRHRVGLQARVNPPLRYLRDLVAQGYVGEMLSCRVHMIRDGILARPSARAWQRENDKGANILTIPFGHTIDAFRFVVGDFASLRGTVTTQVKQWLETDTKQVVDVDAPDTVMISGALTNGAVASAHIATVPFAGSGYQMEIYGRDGTLVASSGDSPQLGPFTIRGAKKGNMLEELPVPASYGDAGPAEPGIVAHMYSELAGAIRSGRPCEPSFDTAVELHRLLDAVRKSGAAGETKA